jgi:hypothetical protein
MTLDKHASNDDLFLILSPSPFLDTEKKVEQGPQPIDLAM